MSKSSCYCHPVLYLADKTEESCSFLEHLGVHIACSKIKKFQFFQQEKYPWYIIKSQNV